MLYDSAYAGFISPIIKVRVSHIVPLLSRTCKTQNEFVGPDLLREIKVVAADLWSGNNIPTLVSNGSDLSIIEGEAELGDDFPLSRRAKYFQDEALKGCPKSQHSLGLLLWSGFAGVEQDAEKSAKLHAAAASQYHLDGMAVLGGCLRTGSGVKQNVALGLKIIEFCSSQGNPTGINKKAALLESNQDEAGAVKLYEDSLKKDRVNALLLFKLGWCLVNGRGVIRKDSVRGIKLWKQAASLAPDEGSEEAAWFLYEEYIRDDPKEAKKWLDLAEELGYN